MKDGNKFSTSSILKLKTFEHIFRNEEELEIEEKEMLEHDLSGECLCDSWSQFENIYSFSKFIEGLLCARHCSRQEFSGKTGQVLALMDLTF